MTSPNRSRSWQITELLVLPETDRDQLRDWTLALTAFDDIPIDVTALPAAGHAADEFLEYAGALVAHRRREPGDDLISALIAAETDGEQLTNDELMALNPIVSNSTGTTAVTLPSARGCTSAWAPRSDASRGKW